jgi:hypothetical protein
MTYRREKYNKQSTRAKKIREGMHTVSVGDLVIIKRPGILVPKGTIALVMAIEPGYKHSSRRLTVAHVLPIGSDKRQRYIQTDLEVYKYGCPILRRATGSR